MRVLIIGIDGYLGWPLALHLADLGYEVGGIDALLRRQWVSEVGGISAIPIGTIDTRMAAWRDRFSCDLPFWPINILDFDHLKQAIADFRPDTIVHLGEMPSAPYSMIDQTHATFTQHNNVIGSLNLLWAIRDVCPHVHLVKLGTMGEYGTPNIDIPEGFFEITYQERTDILPFPRQAGSFYHWSKVHDSNNIMFACRIWGLRSTDIMQGVVFGTRIASMQTDSRLATRLDFDDCFGTVINRFCCQAVIGHPLTVYGTGQQKRSFLPLHDVMQCLRLIIDHPPVAGEYRVINQFDDVYDIRALARIVTNAAAELGLDVTTQALDNPRDEQQVHHYQPARQKLLQLGYRPDGDAKGVIKQMLHDLIPHRNRIHAHRHTLIPSVRWKQKNDTDRLPIATEQLTQEDT